MRCRNCGHADGFVLLVELAVVVHGSSEFSAPDWGLSLECPACSSTDVEGNPGALLAVYAD